MTWKPEYCREQKVVQRLHGMGYEDFQLLSSLPELQAEGAVPKPWYKAACKLPGPNPQLWTRQRSP